MDRTALRKLMVPLSNKERYYQDHPDQADSFFAERVRLHARTATGSDVVTVHLTLNDQDSGAHGAFVPRKGIIDSHSSIAFNHQTRFSRVPLHRHDYLELFFVYAGSCTTLIDGHTFRLDAGDACIMNMNTVHRIDPLGEQDIVINALMSPGYFDAQFISRLATSGPVAQFLAEALSKNAMNERYLLFHTAQEPLVRELLENALCEYLDPGTCSKDVIDSYMMLIFMHLARCYQASKEEEARAASKSYLTEVLHYVEQNCATCTLDETAARFNYHPNYLSRTIKKATGLSFKALVDDLRLGQASFLLMNTDLAVSEVGEQCGWSNRRQFYRKFEQAYGCTPAEYRSRLSVTLANDAM